MSSKNYSRVEPWFGSWPPQIVESRSEMNRQTKEESRIFTKVNISLAVALLLGLALLWLSSLLQDGLLHEIVGGVAIACVTAFILGFTIDRFLKKELAQEAVKATIGYILPDQLRKELGWVVGLEFLAIEHKSEYDIQLDSDGQTVCLNVKMERKLWNFTNTPRRISVGLSIDEFGVKGKLSIIKEVSYWLEGDKRHKPVDISHPKLDEGALVVEGPSVKVPPDKWVKITTKFQETKQLNDVFFMVFESPTVTPEVIVKSCPGITCRKGYTHREGVLKKDEKLSGTLLPKQSEYVRWWPSGKDDK